MEFTDDELVVIVEALREYRLRMPLPRQVVADALIFRCGQQLLEQHKD